MDPLSIAFTAASIGNTCFKLATAIYEYVEEVKDVDKAISLFGGDLETLSHALGNVEAALKKNAVALTTTLENDFKLLNSLGACIQDCGKTINSIETTLEDTQTHGRVGSIIRRPVTHWKLKEKKQELGLLRDRVVSFHTAMNMSLQMISISIALHTKSSNESMQDNVLKEIGQLREQIKRLMRVARTHGADNESLPSTVQQCLDSAIALDTAASTVVDDKEHSILGAMTQGPIEKVHGWMRNSHSWEPPLSNLAFTEEIPEQDEQSTISPSVSRTNAPTKITEETSNQSSSHSSWSQTQLQKAQDLDEAGRFESAKALCRKVIHESELTNGTNDPFYREGIIILAEIYEKNGDHDEAKQLRDMIDIEKRVVLRDFFKESLKSQNPKDCIDIAMLWATLLHSSKTVNTYRQFLQGLPTDEFCESVVLITLTATGNSFLLQLMLSRGTPLHTEVAVKDWFTDTITALTCAMHFKHYILVQILLEHSPESATSNLFVMYLENAIQDNDVKMVQLIFGNISNRSIAKRIKGQSFKKILTSHHFEIAKVLVDNGVRPNVNFDLERTVLRNAIEKSDYDLVQFLLEQGVSPSVPEAALRNGKFFDSHGWSPGNWAQIKDDLVKDLPLRVAVKKADLRMTGLLLQYGAKRYFNPGSDGFNEKHETGPKFDPIFLAVQQKSLEMMKLLVTKKSDVSFAVLEETINSAWEEGINYLLSIDPSYANTNAFSTAWSNALASACRDNSLEKINFLAKESSQVTYSAIIQALQCKKPGPINHLLSINPSWKDIAVIYAAEGDGKSNSLAYPLQLVLNLGGNPNGENQGSGFPLGIAASEGSHLAVKSLLDAGADVNKTHTKDPEKCTALDLAVRAIKKNMYIDADKHRFENLLKTISILVHAGAKVDQVDITDMGKLSNKRRKVSKALKGGYA